MPPRFLIPACKTSASPIISCYAAKSFRNFTSLLQTLPCHHDCGYQILRSWQAHANNIYCHATKILDTSFQDLSPIPYFISCCATKIAPILSYTVIHLAARTFCSLNTRFFDFGKYSMFLLEYFSLYVYN